LRSGQRGRLRAHGCSIFSGSEVATALVWDVSDLKDYWCEDRRAAHSRIAPGPPRWNELAGNDICAAYRAAWALWVPSAVTFLRDRLKVATMAETISSPEVLRSLRAIMGWSPFTPPRPAR
jgi:hypothetical protein